MLSLLRLVKVQKINKRVETPDVMSAIYHNNVNTMFHNTHIALEKWTTNLRWGIQNEIIKTLFFRNPADAKIKHSLHSQSTLLTQNVAHFYTLV